MLSAMPGLRCADSQGILCNEATRRKDRAEKHPQRASRAARSTRGHRGDEADDGGEEGERGEERGGELGAERARGTGAVRWLYCIYDRKGGSP